MRLHDTDIMFFTVAAIILTIFAAGQREYSEIRVSRNVVYGIGETNIRGNCTSEEQKVEPSVDNVALDETYEYEHVYDYIQVIDK